MLPSSAMGGGREASTRIAARLRNALLSGRGLTYEELAFGPVDKVEASAELDRIVAR